MTDGSNRQQQHRNPALDSAFQLGDWQVDPAMNCIVDRYSGEQRHLEPRLMKLLCHLAANAGAVISRDELVALLWPRVVVNENSLTRAVSALRKHLDAPATPARRAVETIPKRGYRLGIAVHKASTPAAGERAPIPRQPQSVNQQSAISATLLQSPRALLTAGIGASLCLLLAISLSSRPTAPAPTPAIASFSDEVVFASEDFTDSRFKLSATRLSDATPGVIEAPAVSPDRQRFAFIERDLAASSIYLGRMDADYEPVAVFSVPYRLSNLTWSPVGNALLFARQDELAPAVMFQGSDSSSELMRLDLDTGAVSRLVEGQQPATETNAPESNLTFFSAPALAAPFPDTQDSPQSLQPRTPRQPGPQWLAQPAAALPYTPV